MTTVISSSQRWAENSPESQFICRNNSCVHEGGCFAFPSKSVLNYFACSGERTKNRILNEYFALCWHQLVSRTFSKWKVRNNLFDRGPLRLAGNLFWTSLLWFKRAALRNDCQANIEQYAQSREYIVERSLYGSLLLSALSAQRHKRTAAADLLCFPAFLSSDRHTFQKQTAAMCLCVLVCGWRCI